MIIFNAAYYVNSEVDIPNNEVPILVTSAGQSKLETLPKFDTVRPNGRRDYQIIYIKSGSVHYTTNGKDYIAQKGSVLLYKPFEPQYYTLYLEDSPDVYWIHFTGNQVESTLKKLDLFDEMLYTLNSDNKYDQIIYETIIELKNKSLYYSDICNASLQKLMLLIARNRTTESDFSNSTERIVNEIISFFNTNYSQKFNMDELAKRYGFSPSWFSRLFNKHTNMSPTEYLNQVRMEKAKLMLRTTDNISDVAFAVGYNDPLYFSRIFRKLNGVSPSEYRKKNKNITPSTLDELPWYKNSFENEMMKNKLNGQGD